MIRVLIVDDHELFNELLGHMLSYVDDIKVVGRLQNGNDAIAAVELLKPDVILMDISMPVMNGLEAILRIRKIDQNVKILMLTASNEDEDIDEAIENGANGYLLKSVTKEQLILAIRSIYSGIDIFKKHAVSKKDEIDHVVHRTVNGVFVKVNGISVELNNRELEVIKMIVEGMSASEIAKTIFVAEGRVRNIITEIISKLMLDNKTQLAVFAIKNKLVNLKN